ncbi:Man1-Src1p-C-terminal domain-containing protein, partial [Tubulinosema ratisbonensis]
MRDKPNKSDYLDKSFDYTKLTKDQIREILFDNNIKDIPPVTSKKDIFIDFYKKNIYDKIDLLKQQVMPNDEGIEDEDKKTTENVDLFRKKSPMHKKLTNHND